MILSSLQHKLLFTFNQITPDGRHPAKVLHHLRNRAKNLIDILIGILLTERQTERAVRDFMRSADREQYVARFERTGRTRRPGGRADASHVQKQKQRLALNPLKAEIHISGQGRRRCPSPFCSARPRRRSRRTSILRRSIAWQKRSATRSPLP